MAAPEKLTFGSYEVLQNPDGSPCLLGQGSFGLTYKAQHVLLGRITALKVIREDLLNRGSKADAEETKSFLSEARAVSKLHHPGIAMVHDCALDKGVFYYAMEYCDGGTLQDRCEKVGPLPWPEVRQIALQIASALDYAHANGFLHRDIKPANIMLNGQGKSRQCKLIDFGLAKKFNADNETSEATVRKDQENFRGNFATASPEQILEKPLDQRSDLFSLGVTLWWLIIGKNPFGELKRGPLIADRVGPSSYSIALPDDLDPEARLLLEGLLEKNADHRTATAHEVVERLTATHGTVVPAAAGVPEPPVILEPLQGPPDLEDGYLVGGTLATAIHVKLYSGECLATRQPVIVIIPDASLDPAARGGMRVAASRKLDFGAYAFLDWRSSGPDDVFVIAKPDGCSLLGILRKFGPARFADALPFLTHLARCFDASHAWTTFGIRVDPGDILVRARDGGTDLDRFHAWSDLDPLATRSLPFFSSGADHSGSNEATLSTSAQEFPPLAQFAALVYRVLAGSAVRYAAFFTASGYVMASGLSEDGNTLLADTICDPESQPSACRFIQLLASLESLPVAEITPLIDPPGPHDIAVGKLEPTAAPASANPRARVAPRSLRPDDPKPAPADNSVSVIEKVAELERQLALVKQAAEKEAREEAEKQARLAAAADQQAAAARRAAEEEAKRKDTEAKRQQAEQAAAAKLAAEEARRLQDEAKRKEDETKRLQAEAKRAADEQARLAAAAKRAAEEEARRQQEDAKRKDEAAKRQLAEEKTRQQADAKWQANEQARLQAEAKRAADEEARRKQAEAKRLQAEEQTRLKAQARQASATAPTRGKGKAIAIVAVILVLASALGAVLVFHHGKNSSAKDQEIQRRKLADQEQIEITKRNEAQRLKDEQDRKHQLADAQRLKDEEAKRAEAQRLKDEEAKRVEAQRLKDEQAKILPVKISLPAATPKGAYPCSGFTVEELDGKGRKIDKQQATAGFDVQRGSRWKVTLTGDLYGGKDKALASAILPIPATKDLKTLTIHLPALTEIQVANPADGADYSQIKIAGPAASNANSGVQLTTPTCDIKAADLTPEPEVLASQPFPDANKPLHVPLAGAGPWTVICTGSQVLPDKPLPPVQDSAAASPILLDVPAPLSGTYTLVTPMTRFPDTLETTKVSPVKEKDGNNYEVDYFNRLVYLLPKDDKSALEFRQKFKKLLGRSAELPHYLGVVMDLDLKSGKNGRVTVLLTYPQVGFIQYQGDLSAEMKPDGSLKLTSKAPKGFSGQAEHPGIAAWAAEYDKAIRTKDAANLKKFMQESLAEWAAYQTNAPQKKSLLNFSKWDYVDDDNTFRFEVEPRNGTLCLKKAVQVYRKKDLYDENEQYKEPFPVGSVFLREPVDMTRAAPGRKPS